MPLPLLKAKLANNFSYTFEALGVPWVIESPVRISHVLRQSIAQQLDDFCADYSRFLPDSFVHRVFASGAGEYATPKNFKEIIDFYAALTRATDGAISPLVGQTLSDMGYDETYSFQRREKVASVPGSGSFVVKNGVLRTDRALLFDIGAAGKGFAVDMLANLLRKNKLEDFVIDASGDIFCQNKDTTIAQKIGLQHPVKKDEIVGYATLSNHALCGSAPTIRQWRDSQKPEEFLHHIIDARTGRPATGVIATWAIAETTFLADGLASALFFTEPSRLKSIANFQYVRLHADNTVEYSDNFKGEIFA